MFRFSRDFIRKVTRVPVVIKPEVPTEKPLVILSSWAGAKEKTMTEYSNFYKKKGYSSIQFKGR